MAVEHVCELLHSVYFTYIGVVNSSLPNRTEPKYRGMAVYRATIFRSPCITSEGRGRVMDLSNAISKTYAGA